MENFLSVQTLILVLTTYLVTAGIKSLSTLMGTDLSGYGAAWTAAAVALLIGVFQTVAIPAIPVAYLPIVEQVAGLIITLLGAMGIHKTVKAFQAESKTTRIDYGGKAQ